MKTKIAIYLAGSIRKGHETADEFFWTEKDKELLARSLDRYEVSFLNPALRMDDLSDQYAVFGRDMLQVFSSNVVIVDARDRRGLGVGAEMMWAKINQIPLIAWAPKNSHYNKEQTTILGVPIANFIHPFVDSLSDAIVETLEEAALWIDGALANPETEIKGLPYIGSAIEYYKESQLERDHPMRELLSSSEELKERAERATPQVVLASF